MGIIKKSNRKELAGFIEEIETKKAILCSNISRTITEFEYETGLTVSNISLNKLDITKIGDKHSQFINAIEVDVKLS